MRYHPRLRPLLAAAVLAGFWPSSNVGGQEPKRPVPGIEDNLDAWLAMGGGHLLEDLQKLVRRYDRDRNGLTRDDLAKYEDNSSAGKRTSRVKFLMQYDLDGDGTVTREEAVRAVRLRHRVKDNQVPDERAAKQIEQSVATVMKADVNGDGVITFDEMRVDPDARAIRGRPAVVDMLFKYDPNKDGRITEDEVAVMVNEAFKRLDKNGNHQIDPEERMPFLRLTLAMMDKKTSTCDLRAPAANEDVIVFGMAWGGALSTVTTSGQDGVTTTGKVVVEPGTRPLYLVLISEEGVIWQIEGATSRISRVAVILGSKAPSSASGVTGLDKAKVFFAPPQSCPTYFPGLRKPIEAERRAALEHILGRADIVFSGTMRLEVAHLPSGKMETTPPNRIPQNVSTRDFVLAAFERTYPRGIVDIDPAAVIAPKPAERYTLLPRNAGLLRLMRDGAIEYYGDPKDRMLRITKPIERFPAGFANGYFVKFILAPDIPVPKGNAVNPCILSEETGEPVPGSGRCPKR